MSTCNACSILFPDFGSQRAHMKSEWHRYNLKRKVALLPAIDEALFNNKVASLSLSSDREISENDPVNLKQTKKKKEIRTKKKRPHRCVQDLRSDGKSSGESNVIGNNVSGYNEKKSDSKCGDSEEALIQEKLAKRVTLSPSTCLFCHARKESHFGNVDENINHMSIQHGLYIPEKRFLIDKTGLISYLGEKIGFGNICLCCSYQGKNIEAVRDHMLKKRHMRIPYETEDEKLEISQFYDFTPSYNTDIKPLNKSSNETSESEWEDVSSEDEGRTDENVDISVEHTGDTREAGSFIYKSGDDLILPTGTVVGHRNFVRYYKQNLPQEPELTQGQGTVLSAEARHPLKMKDYGNVATQRRVWKSENVRENKYGKKALKFANYQPHYRDQLLQ